MNVSEEKYQEVLSFLSSHAKKQKKLKKILKNNKVSLKDKLTTKKDINICEHEFYKKISEII